VSNKYDKCRCGGIKDTRAKRCSICAGIGFPVGGLIITREQLCIAAKNSHTIAEVARRLDITRCTARKRLLENKIDISHFDPCRFRPKPLSKILCKESGADRANLRRRILLETDIKYECHACGSGPTWNGSELTLQLHHINGNSRDNRLENLQIVTQRFNSCKTQGKYLSKYKGVSLNKKSNKWYSYITINYKIKYLGSYEKEYDAHLAYQKELKKIEQ